MKYQRQSFLISLLLIALSLVLLVELACPPRPASIQVSPEVTSVAFITNQLGSPPGPADFLNQESPFKQSELATAGELSTQVADWLGPAAPLALSPFFGMTCLSALAMWGPDWLPARGWLDANGPLNNPWVFGIFLTLTILTSLPRFLKVTKPLAQLAEQAETYSVLIILFAVRFVAASTNEAVVDESIFPLPVAAGLGQMTTEMLLYTALVINVIVINAVKVFFELLIWMTPFPMVDAIFETGNKTVSGAMMALYAFSPLLATILNLVLFVAAAVVFRWVTRQVTFYRTILVDYATSLLLGWKWQGGSQPVTGFLREPWHGLSARTRVTISYSENVWRVHRTSWIFPVRQFELSDDNHSLEIFSGTMTSDLVLGCSGEEPLTLVISRRYATELPELLRKLNGRMVSSVASPA